MQERYRVAQDPDTGEKYLPVAERGVRVTADPILSKGTAFSPEERVDLGLQGLLPPAVSTIDQQITRVWENYCRQHDDLERYLYLVALQDRNETLFYRLLMEHTEEMAPIVYTPTVGEACQKFSHIYRKERGLYITEDDVGRMTEVVSNAPHRDVAVIVATDNEGILGIGDQGAGGMGIPIGKLTLYSLGAGIHPARCLPVCIDVGTNNPALAPDPLYLGVPRCRLRGDRYYAVLDAFVEAVQKVFPEALLQWEDFSRQQAWSVLERYRDHVCSFNDDIQGTGAVTVAGLYGVARVTGKPLRGHTFCVNGTGAGGGGILWVIVAALEGAGLSRGEAMQRIVCTDSRGLILDDRPGLDEFKKQFARDRALVADWDISNPDRIDLTETVRNFMPSVLIGTSGQPRSFTREIVEIVGDAHERPAIFALSNPTSKCDVLPADAIEWTGGRALVATGSPFDPVEYEGKTHVIGQGNNVFCFPGIGLGVLASNARYVSDAMMLAAAKAVAEEVSEQDLATGGLYPSIGRLREVSQHVAHDVALAALDGGMVDEEAAEGIDRDTLAEKIRRESWVPEYVPYRAV